MARSAQLWPGARMTAFLRTHLSADPSVDEALADRLAQQLSKKINRMLVWEAGQPAPANDHAAPRSEAPGPSTRADTGLGSASDHAFDPFAFSVVVVLAKKGEAALLERLNTIDDIKNLRAIATAQHLGLKGPLDTADAVRLAMVAGAKQRLADRRAAAS